MILFHNETNDGNLTQLEKLTYSPNQLVLRQRSQFIPCPHPQQKPHLERPSTSCSSQTFIPRPGSLLPTHGVTVQLICAKTTHLRPPFRSGFCWKTPPTQTQPVSVSCYPPARSIITILRSYAPPRTLPGFSRIGTVLAVQPEMGITQTTPQYRNTHRERHSQSH